MKCLHCQHENSDTAKFCEECGTRLVRVCPSCGYEVSPRAKFCGECGTSLTEQTPAFPRIQIDKQTSGQRGAATLVGPLSSGRGVFEVERRQLAAERRQLTVMFCDLVGSTALSEQLDPEELREVVRAYQEACATVISRFEGHIAQYLGDGLLAYFGYPTAHEDDPQRAVRVGLEIVGAIHQWPLQSIRLPYPVQVRIGVHTGPVVVGEIGGGRKHEQLALGDTPNIAARIQGIAEPDTVVISSATYRLVQGLFECCEPDPRTLKGISAPVKVYQVLRESGVSSRFEVAVNKGLTPLVGRDQDVGLLLERWEETKEGEGQVVLMSGEAGIGKSRLVQVLKERVTEEAYTRLECRCSPYHQNSALYPVIDLLQRMFELKREDSPQAKLQKLEAGLSQYRLALPDTVPLFASLLSVPVPESYAPLDLTPQRQREKTLEALLTMLLEIAAKRSLLFIVEGLHWVDPSTLEFLSLLIDQVPTARILVLLTFRPEFTPPWVTRSHLTHLTLNRLSRGQAEVMVERVAGGKALPPRVFQQIVARTDRIPLFVEELTKMVLESGLLRERENYYELIGPLPPLAIPTTLQDSLMARLDRLATAKEVAQLGATLGREFTYELLQAVSPLNEGTLQRELTRLVAAELLHQRGLPPQARYIFKHALIQEAAYQSLLRSKRQQYHQRIAQVLEEQFPETREAHPELLARHYMEADLTEQAIAYWQGAGQKAVECSANVEAIGHLTKGLELLQTLPDTPKRTQQELALQIALGTPLIATKGYAAPEVQKAYARARELCQQVGETPQFFPALRGLWVFCEVRAELRTAQELGEQLLTMAQTLQDPALLVEAHRALGNTLFWFGEFASAQAHLEQGISLYNPQQHRSLAFLYGTDPRVICLFYVAWVLWYLGYPDQALKKIQEVFQELSHSHSLAVALNGAAFFHQLRRERQAAQERAEAAIALSTEQGFTLNLAMGTILQGWALAGQGEERILQMRQGMAAYRATGAEVARPWFLALLAEAYGERGQVEEGFTLLAEALNIVRKTGEHFYEAELYRLKGELLLVQVLPAQEGKSGKISEAKECFRQAIDIARRQSAKSLELRAVMSLSRLLQKQGKNAESLQMLAEIYGWFTEGFDTIDLKEAKALLEELGD